MTVLYYLGQKVELLDEEGVYLFEKEHDEKFPDAPSVEEWIAGTMEEKGKIKAYWFWPDQLKTEPWGEESYAR